MKGNYFKERLERHGYTVTIIGDTMCLGNTIIRLYKGSYVAKKGKEMIVGSIRQIHRTVFNY